jgi:hypothetical protein
MPIAKTTECRLLCASTCAYDIEASGVPDKPPHYPAVGWTTVPSVYSADTEKINACLVGTNQDDGVILAFRGTLLPGRHLWLTAEDWANDFRVRPVAKPGILPPGMMVHKGFWDAVDSLWSQLVPAVRDLLGANPHSKLYITGHSKGGAMAAIAAARLFFQEDIRATGVFLYASARAGNSKFVSGFPAEVPAVRYEYQGDIVPLSPPNLEFISVAARAPLLRDLLKEAKDWDYTSLGELRFIKKDGTIVGQDPSLAETHAREIIELLVPGGLVALARAHGPWCKSSICDGGYMLGVCPTGLCGQSP